MICTVWNSTRSCAATQTSSAGCGSPRISSEIDLVSTTITDRRRAVRRQTRPAAARDRLRRAAQSAGRSPRPGSAPGMPRRAHAQSLFDPCIDIADRQRSHCDLFCWVQTLYAMTALNEATELPLNLSGGEPVVDYIPPGAQLGAGVHRGASAIGKPAARLHARPRRHPGPRPLDPHSGRDHSVGRSHGSALSKRSDHDLAVGERGGFPEVGRAQDCASDEALAPKADDLNRFGIDSLIP